MKRRFFLCLLLILCLAVAALFAVTMPDELKRPDANDYARHASTAIAQDSSTSLGMALADDEQTHPGQSGFRLLTTGTESLHYRMALIQAAEKSLDLQYYAIHDDVSSNLLLEAVLRAAARGVRVRFLIDSISMKEVGESLSVLDKVKNVEIRVFNPLVTRDQSFISRITGTAADLGKATRRMHNKSMIADNQLAIMGGRNLGDEYFDGNADSNFKDTDIVTAGPVTARLSHNFDEYWNCDDSFPIELIRKPESPRNDVAELKTRLKQRWESELKTEEGRKMLQSDLPHRLKDGEVSLIWARAEVTADKADKVDDKNAASKPMERIKALLEDAGKEFIVVSPYFVPQKEGVDLLKGLTGRGIDVKVLTNSLASTDVVAVHTGYKRYRKAVLESGVKLYEFKATGGQRPKQRLLGASAPARASLHAKLYVIDRRKVMIGSFNFDPRSISLNTELAVLVDSPQIASQVIEMFNQAVAPRSSYRLEGQGQGDDLRITWITEKDGKEARFSSDPQAGFWRNVQASLISLLPIENQL